MKKIDYILFGILVFGLVWVAWKSYTLSDKVEYITTTDTIVINDTITEWKPYDVYHYKYDTAYLPMVDTINDTILKIDSVLVTLPINIYKFDSIIEDSTHITHVGATISGFNVEMQELSIDTKITPQQPKKEPWYTNIGVGVGLMYGTGGAGVGVGLMYKL